MSGERLFYRLDWRPCVVVLFTLLVPIGISASASSQDDSSDERMLLLKNGRVVDGTISASPNGYVVHKPTGRLVIPFNQVQLQAKDLKDAYRKLRATMPLETADQHMRLARWCLSYELFAEARTELRDTLVLEPNRESARRMLRKVHDILDPESPVEPTPAPPRLTPDGFQTPEVKSLSSLSRELAREFTRTVQPILINKCANGSCHGSRANNEFRLTRVRIGRSSHRVFVERNLAATLKFVDLNKPDESPLISHPDKKHGLDGRSIFFGTHGADQFDALHNWVRSVAKEKLKNKTDTGRKQSLARFEPSRPSKQVAPRTIGTEIGQQAFGKSAVGETERLLRQKSQDAFDPEIFNRFR